MGLNKLIIFLTWIGVVHSFYRNTACDTNPCQHDGTCEIHGTDGYVCQCKGNWHGLTCGEFRCPVFTCSADLPFTSCAAAPCDVQTCPNYKNAFCCNNYCGGCNAFFYTGGKGIKIPSAQCGSTQVSTDPCNPNPCKNYGLCVKKDYHYKCQCAVGWTGPTCLGLQPEEKNYCLPNPCKNGGVCYQQFKKDGFAEDGYSCVCMGGHTGFNCDKSSNPCDPNPCNHGGVCTQTGDGSYTCTCTTGYYGKTCNDIANPCEPNPCKNGFCVGSADTGTYTCICTKGYYGQLCEWNPCNPYNPCKNGGTCHTDGTNWSCKCPKRYYGSECSEEEKCPTIPIGTAGSCDEKCSSDDTCAPGQLCCSNGCGHECMGGALATPGSCDFNQCANGGTCSYSSGTYSCKCPQGYSGILCDIYNNPCEPNPCKHGGNCFTSGQGTTYFCECASDYYGNNCENFNDPCSPNPCNNDGSCQRDGIYYKCTCKKGYTGPRCSGEINACSIQPCNNGGTCHTHWADFYCTCKDGYNGKTCNDVVDSCSPNPCRNSGTCTRKPFNEFLCSCSTGYTGLVCQDTEVPDPCKDNPCQNGGYCVVDGHSYWCKCKTGYTGSLCEVPPNLCSNQPCRNGGTCEITPDGSYSCRCTREYFGRTCTEKNLCFPNPCENSGKCAIRGSNPFCECIKEWTGPFCSDPVTPSDSCNPNPCRNEGTCSVTQVGFSCKCKHPYTGNTCESILNPCVPNRCENGASCDPEGSNSFKCTCTSGWTGQLCADRDACSPTPCANGGVCTNTAGPAGTEFSCACINRWTGPTCSIPPSNPCVMDLCMNLGTCVVQPDFTPRCVCTSRWTGTRCETATADNPCKNNPCTNGGSCILEPNGFSCNCPNDRTGNRCQFAATLCNPGPCMNGGTCTVVLGQIETCKCLDGWKGTRCELTDPCFPFPCQPNEVCVDNNGQAGCEGEGVTILSAKKKLIAIAKDELIMFLKAYEANPCSWTNIIAEMMVNVTALHQDLQDLYRRNQIRKIKELELRLTVPKTPAVNKDVDAGKTAAVVDNVPPQNAGHNSENEQQPTSSQVDTHRKNLADGMSSNDTEKSSTSPHQRKRRNAQNAQLLILLEKINCCITSLLEKLCRKSLKTWE
ncbi:unnamed protein product [Mytilus coruscus]|uniref:Uncharacterized protein n=1 Tax=Mytilus coruscus TaxID=42192 RepID=A0A6J8DXQ6_MYTCO|nr:unnamed protein product [Mytilus coruscus]